MTKTITVTANSVAGMVHKIDELPFTDERVIIVGVEHSHHTAHLEDNPAWCAVELSMMTNTQRAAFPLYTDSLTQGQLSTRQAHMGACWPIGMQNTSAARLVVERSMRMSRNRVTK